MTVKFTLEDLQVLNQIQGMLQSTDREINSLGYALFKQHRLFKEFVRDSVYEISPGRKIPVHWFIRKADELVLKESEGDMNGERWVGLIIPIVRSLLIGDPKFEVRVHFDFSEYARSARSLHPDNLSPTSKEEITKQDNEEIGPFDF